MLKKAILFMAISAFAFALLNVFVKSLERFSVYQIVFFRSLGTLLFTIPLIRHKKLSFLGNQKGLLMLRGTFGVVSMIFFFLSLKYIATGSAVSLRYISPIFAAVFALFILKEKVKRVQWFYFAIAFFGVILLKGLDSQIQSSGVIYAIISAVFAGLVFIIIRKIGNKDHPLIVVNYFMVIATIVGGLLSITAWTKPVGFEWLLFLSLGVFGYFGQFYMTKAFQISETSLIAPFKYIEVLFTLLIGVIWLDESYTITSLIGICLIIFGLTLNVIFGKKKKEI